MSLSVAVSEDWPPRAPCVMPVRDTVIDRSNHHLFQPLLYQVATAMLAPGDIAAPICHLLRRQRNVTVAMAEVTGVDAANRRVLVNYLGRPDMPFAYDYLILATGASHSYFGHNEFAPFAPGMTSLLDAESVRAKVLKAFETAETAEDPAQHQDLLTLHVRGQLALYRVLVPQVQHLLAPHSGPVSAVSHDVL